MNVLGLHSFSHDAGAALVCEGRLFSIALERLTRRKHDGRFPTEAIEYVMSQAGLSKFSEIDLAACDLLNLSFDRTRRELRRMGYKGELRAVSHHDAHAASAYFTSPFEEAAILVVDASGSFAREMPGLPHPMAAHKHSRELQSSYVGRGGRLTAVLKTFSGPGRSLGPGAMYGLGAMMAGFSDLEGGKLMALAAFGKRDGLFPDCRFTDFEGHYLAPGDPERDPLTPENIGYYSKRIFRGVKPRRPGEPIRQIHCEIARAVQESTMRAVVDMARRLHHATGCRNLCMAGGFGLNCATNSAILEQTPFESLFVQPAATDAGIPLGAALYGRHVVAQESFRPRPFFSPFLGKKYSESEIMSAIQAAKGIEHRKPKSIYKSAARLLADGKIGGWFRGGSEHGPRALGARSILADPRTKGLKDRLDNSIKLRESFRPYAPAALEGNLSSSFNSVSESPYMLLLAGAKPKAKKNLSSVVHIDGTARLQTVGEKTNPGLHRLLTEFHAIAGLPVLLNTSFNRRGEPIVETPEDAISCFLASGLDFLALEGHLILRKQKGDD